jgi:hypothetical protein
MIRVLVVEKIDENPLTVLRSELIDEKGRQDLDMVVGSVVRSHNDRAVVKADGALAWALDGQARTIEFRLFGQDLRAIEPREAYNLHGNYQCWGSGQKYKYYGRYTAFRSGRESSWEARLFAHDKKFRFDGVLNSPDQLAKFSGPLLNMRLDRELLRALVVGEIETAIERWDAARSDDGAETAH